MRRRCRGRGAYSITEGESSGRPFPLYRMERGPGGGGGGEEFEPDTGTVVKSVTVVFELR